MRAVLAAAVLVAASITAAEAAPRFTQMDVTKVRVYFAAKPIVWMGVPIDLRRGFAAGKPLPSGMPVNELPHELLAKLPAHRGYKYLRVGGDIVLLAVTTHVVADIMENVFD